MSNIEVDEGSDQPFEILEQRLYVEAYMYDKKETENARMRQRR